MLFEYRFKTENISFLAFSLFKPKWMRYNLTP